jgi:BirA family biotin operon repressor/biotin-[acetyl-CoA-carboxylase] ligase
LLAQTLSGFQKLYLDFVEAGGDAVSSGLRAKIIESSATIGELVEVLFPDGSSAVGEAIGIDEGGRLQVLRSTKTLIVAAGDVLHLRTAKRED